MTIQPGTTLGPYEILAAIGAGGMGEVYRARDTRLGRDVAIKTLPESLATDPERLARFRREAETLAALNHPNIAHIYGLERQEGQEGKDQITTFIVMELVEGPTLAERLSYVGSGFSRSNAEPATAIGPSETAGARGFSRAMSLDEALPVAKQLVLALEAAHERGIIHRDLKPANVKVTPEGTVKLLDFGLAKAFEGPSGSSGPAGVGATASPTMSVMATQAGVLLGTAAYMSPEQVRGGVVDKRADIWAFGVVIFEMLTGRGLFGGDTISDTLAGVLREPIDLDKLPASTPQAIRRLIARCLERDPKRRLRDIGEARIAIDDYIANPNGDVSVATAAPAPRSSWRTALPWALVGMLAIALAVIGIRLTRSTAVPVERPATFNLELGKLSLQRGGVVGGFLAISRDGRRVVITAQGESGGERRQRLYQRTLDRLDFVPIAGTEDSSIPFISPDGEWVGFESRGQLKKVAFAGGVPVRICDVKSTPGGATWLEDDTIVLALGGQFLRVPAGGGTPQPVTTTDVNHSWPASIPGRAAVLYTQRSGTGSPGGGAGGHFAVGVLDLNTKQEHVVADNGSYPIFVSGFVVYAQQVSEDPAATFSGGLLAIPFDTARLTATGPPVPVFDDVRVFGGGAGHYGIASNGTLAYVPRAVESATELAWLTASARTQAGSVVPLGETAGAANARLSREDRVAAMQVGTGSGAAVYALSLDRGSVSRVPFDGDALRPIFGPSDNMVTFASPAQQGLWYAPLDGSKPATRLTSMVGAAQTPESWTRDGSALVLTQYKSAVGDVMVLHRGEQDPKPLVATAADERNPILSPDDRWLAYSSNESGRFEVYVRPYPGPGGRYTLSTGGGEMPLWSKDGRRLYYRRLPSTLMAVEVAGGEPFRAGPPQPIVTNVDLDPGARSPLGRRLFDVARDGRFLVVHAPEKAAEQDAVHLILHFDQGIRRRVAPAKP